MLYIWKPRHDNEVKRIYIWRAGSLLPVWMNEDENRAQWIHVHLVSVVLPGTCSLKGEKRGLWAACVLGVSFRRRWCLRIKLSEAFQLLVLANIPCAYELMWRVRTRGEISFHPLSPLVADWTLNSTNTCGRGFVSLCVSLPLSLRVVG